MRKIGINLHAKRGITHEEFLKTAASLGFRCTFTGVREAKEQAEIAGLCAKYGMECETLHAPFGHINDIWYDGEDGDGMMRELLRCVDHCRIAGAGIAVVHRASVLGTQAAACDGHRQSTLHPRGGICGGERCADRL